MVERYLIVWLASSSALAYWWPHWLPTGSDPFLATASWDKGLFAVTMFAIGCLLPRDEIREIGRRWPTVFGGTAIQYTVMPILAFATAQAFRLEGDVLTGVLLVGCVPGAMASNVLTRIARGNVSYSVSLTTLATLLSPIIVPLTLGLFLPQSESSTETVANSAKLLLWIVVGPVVAGQASCRLVPRFREIMAPIAPDLANLTILWIIALVVAKNRTTLGMGTIVVAAVLLVINILGYGFGYLGGRVLRLPEPMRRALTLEIGMQNAGLGAVLATSLFGASAAVPPAIYTFGCMLTGTLLAQFWHRTPIDDGGRPNLQSLTP